MILCEILSVYSIGSEQHSISEARKGKSSGKHSHTNGTDWTDWGKGEPVIIGVSVSNSMLGMSFCKNPMSNTLF